ncbi:hypothetical protein TNCV_3544521 [Trichonephila clavipes]|nr:hypothetical protein TNCV_3544521 [Trichonephila clavipes]
MKITPLKVLRIDADKTLCLSVRFPVHRIVPVRGSKVSVGVGKREIATRTVRCHLDALEELEPLAMYQEDPPL